MNLEDQLRRSLRREPPSSGFAERVAARIAADAGHPKKPSPVMAGRLWMPLAASLVVALSSGWMYERHRERVEAHHAAEQVELALRITGRTLADVQERLAALNERRRQRNSEINAKIIIEGSSSGEPGSVR